MPRRLFAAAATAALALVGLAGCRFETSADAAYVGDTRFSNQSIDQMIAQLKTDGAQVATADEVALRQRIAVDDVFVTVAGRFATERGFAAPNADVNTLAANFAQSSGLPANDGYIQLEAHAQAYSDLLSQSAKPAQLTDGDYRDAFNLLVKQQQADPTDFQGTKQALQSQVADQLARGVAVRNELASAIKRYNVSLNPRYQPASVTITSVSVGSGGSATLVQLNIVGSAGLPPVVDLTPTAPADQSAPDDSSGQ
jgi:hypothetical protein